MRAKMMGCYGVLIMAIAALAATPVFAQQSETSPAVARVSLMKGDVTLMRGDSGEWVAATVNTPVVPGDTIATGGGSRAEVQLDYSNVLRLDENAQVKIGDLNASRLQLQVSHGTVDLAVLQGNQANSEVDTPNVAVQPLQPGTYRIDVNSNELSLVTVRDGQAQVSTPQGSTNVDAGKQITVEGAQNPQYQIVSAQPLDAWDQWNNERNRVIERAANYDHVNRYYTGAQDLDTYGHWVYVPNYDWCWTPYVDAGWVPYSYGRWVWEPFYGWTWVSYDPWGWAPYHYGRWFFYNNIWCWWPGAVTPFYQPLWAPAYVSFIGFGYGYRHFGFGFGYGFSSIGWFPLGPRDRCDPWWGHGHSFHVVDIDHYHGGGGFGHGGRRFRGSNRDLLMTNAHVRRSITTMPAGRFGQEAVFRNRRPVSAQMLRQASFVRGTLPVVPTRTSLTASNHAAVVPRGAMNRANNVRFFSRRSVASPRQNHSFNFQTASIRQMMQSRDHQAPGARAGSPNGHGERTFQMSGANRGQGTVHAFSNDRGHDSAGTVRIFGGRATSQGRPAQSGVPGNQAGWRQFGTPNGQRGTTARGEPQSSFRFSGHPQDSGNRSGAATNWRRFGSGTSGTPSANRVGQQGRSEVNRTLSQSHENMTPRPTPRAQSGQPGWRQFSGNASAAGGHAPRETPRGDSQRLRPGSAPSSGRGRQSGGSDFHRFTPQSTPTNGDHTPGFSRTAPQSNNGGRAEWNRFTPRSEASPQNRGGGFYGGASREQRNYSPRYESRPSYGSRSYSRPPLRLNKPIVTERRPESYRAPRARSESGSRGGFRGSSGSFSRGGGRGGGGGHHRR